MSQVGNSSIFSYMNPFSNDQAIARAQFQKFSQGQQRFTVGMTMMSTLLVGSIFHNLNSLSYFSVGGAVIGATVLGSTVFKSCIEAIENPISSKKNINNPGKIKIHLNSPPEGVKDYLLKGIKELPQANYLVYNRSLLHSKRDAFFRFANPKLPTIVLQVECAARSSRYNDEPKGIVPAGYRGFAFSLHIPNEFVDPVFKNPMNKEQIELLERKIEEEQAHINTSSSAISMNVEQVEILGSLIQKELLRMKKID